MKKKSTRRMATIQIVTEEALEKQDVIDEEE